MCVRQSVDKKDINFYDGDRTDFDNGQDKISTRQKILDCAVNLFASKGYTETSIRELAAAVGLKGGSIYSHFPSKQAILDYILEDYSALNSDTFNAEAASSTLREHPTADGVLACLRLSFPEGRDEYYLKVLCVILQEQHRNPDIRDFVSKRVILNAEHDISAVLQMLKDMNIIRQDANIDFWMKTSSSLLYAFASRRMLGIGDNSPSIPGMESAGATNFSGMGMVDLLRYLFDMLLETCGVKKNT